MEQTLTGTSTAYPSQHLTFAGRIFNVPVIQRAALEFDMLCISLNYFGTYPVCKKAVIPANQESFCCRENQF